VNEAKTLADNRQSLLEFVDSSGTILHRRRAGEIWL
jgi:hypothetical protein